MIDKTKELEKQLEELKHQVKQLRDENQYYQGLIDNSPDPVALGDGHGDLVYVNKAFTRMTGYSLPEIATDAAHRLFSVLELTKNPLRFDLLNQGLTTLRDRDLIHKDGHVVPVEMKTIKIKEDLYQTVYRDITDRKKILDDLAEKEQSFKQLFENMTNGFAFHEMIFDENGKAIDYIYLDANPAYGRLTGLNVTNLIGKKVSEVIPGLDYSWVQSFGEVVKTGKSCLIENFVEPLNRYYELLAYKTGINRFAVVFTEITQKKLAENIVKESEERFRKIVENIPVGIGIADLNGKIKYQNTAFLTLFGYLPDSISTIVKQFQKSSPNTTSAINADGGWAPYLENVLGTSSQPAPVREYEINDAEGNLRNVEINFSVINNDLFFTFNDITFRKLAENRLKESEKNFRLLAENSSDLISRHTPEGTFIYATPSFEHTLGYSTDELVGANPYDFFHPADKGVVAGSHQTILAAQVDQTIEYRFRHKNGGYVWLETTSKSIFDDKGGIVEIHSSSRDISKRKKAERGLEESQRMLKTVIDAIPLRVFWKDRNSVYLGSNRKHAIDNGFTSSADIIGKTDFQIGKNYDEAAKFVADDQEVMSTGVPKLNMEESFTTANGVMWLNTNKIPLVDASGVIFGVLGTYEDITEKKQIIQALYESEQRIRIIVRNAPLVLFIVSNDGVFKFSDGKGLEKLGLLPGQVVGKSFREIYKDYPDIIRNVDLALSGKSTRETIFLGDLAFDTQFEPILDKNGVIDGIIGVSTDVSEKVKADKAVFASEQRIGLIVKNAPLIVFAIDKNRHFTLGDGKGLEKLGLKPNELRGVSAYDFYHNNAEIIENINKVFSGQAFRETMVVNNIVFDTQYTPIFDDKGEVDSIVGIATDITDRVEAENEMKRSEEKFRLLAENLPGVIYMCKNDKNWTSLYLNDYIYKMTGYKKEQFYSGEIAFANLYHPDDKVRIYEEVDEALALRLPFHLLYRLKHANGHFIWVEEVGDAIRKNDKVQYLEGYMSDVSELKNAEEGLKNMNIMLEKRVEERTSQLEKVNKELSEFAYIVSHDLKAPLRGINQLAEWLATDYGEALGIGGTDLLVLLKGRVNRLENLINAILEYSRAGRATIRDEVVDTNKVVNVAVEMLSPPPSISIYIDTELPVVIGNKIQFGQVFQNLIGNAIKFMDKEHGVIHIGHIEENLNYVFYVHDNGPGIEQKYFAKIFQIFQTLNSRDEKESTGVGLALVKKIIELYGGTISVESEKGKGSTFTFRLPKPKLYEQ